MQMPIVSKRNNKYRFTGANRKIGRTTVWQIVGNGSDVVGGWIESERNLSFSGSCWISEDASVYEQARISGDATVYGRAEISGTAHIYDWAFVSGDAKVYGIARVYGDACVYGGTVHGNAEVYGRAYVGGNAEVRDTARVYDDAHISGKAKILGDASLYNQDIMTAQDVKEGFYHQQPQQKIEQERIPDKIVLDNLIHVHFGKK